jgi:hypothetical protein
VPAVVVRERDGIGLVLKVRAYAAAPQEQQSTGFVGAQFTQIDLRADELAGVKQLLRSVRAADACAARGRSPASIVHRRRTPRCGAAIVDLPLLGWLEIQFRVLSSRWALRELERMTVRTLTTPLSWATPNGFTRGDKHR